MTAHYEWNIPRDDQPGGVLHSFVVRMDAVELERLLAAYDPASGTSPTVGDARPVLRALLNAALERQS
jgi:hypothetical protein